MRGSLSTISLTWANTMPSREGGRLDDGGRVLGVRGEVQVALAVGLRRGDQCYSRRQVDIEAAEQLVVGMDRADRELLRLHEIGNGGALRSGVAEVDLADHALLEELDMGGQRDARHHEMDVAHVLLVERGELVGEEVRLLLVVAFDAEDVAGLDDASQRPRAPWRRSRTCRGPACRHVPDAAPC